ncbi:unnamed protein product [Coccothraustes coccothraustes]
MSWDHRVSATSGAQGQRGPESGAGANEPPGGGGVSPGRGRARSPGARGALAGPRELRPPAHPVPGRKVIRSLPASLSLRFCSAARAALSASCVTGFRLAARQRERTSTLRVGKKFGASSITLPGWLGAAVALPSPRPVSQPLTQSTALRRRSPPAHSQRRSSGLLGQGRGPKGAKRLRDKLPCASRKPCVLLALLFRTVMLPAARRAPCRRYSAGTALPVGQRCNDTF